MQDVHELANNLMREHIGGAQMDILLLRAQLEMLRLQLQAANNRVAELESQVKPSPPPAPEFVAREVPPDGIIIHHSTADHSFRDSSKVWLRPDAATLTSADG